MKYEPPDIWTLGVHTAYEIWTNKCKYHCDIWTPCEGSTRHPL